MFYGPLMIRGTIERAVLITATEPAPRRNGKSVVLSGILDHLSQRLGPRNLHVVVIGRDDVTPEGESYHRHVVPKPGTPQQIISVARNVVARNQLSGHRLSLQEAVLRSPRVERALWTELAEIQADLEIWDTIRTGQFVMTSPRRPPPRHRARRILYVDDLLSERYATMLQTLAPGSDPGGEFGRLLPPAAGRLLAVPRIHRPLLRLERRLVAGSEQRQPPWFDGAYLISPAETRRLRARCQDARIGTLPPLLPAPRPRPRTYRGGKDFVVLGGFAYAPNRDGLDWFLRHCRDAVQAQIPDVTITVVGSGTERSLPSASGWAGAVRFLGWVDDLDSILDRAAALLSPLRSGSGVKIKVLEALARGLPVVATRAGVQGVTVDGEGPGGCLVGDTPGDLATAMRAVLEPATNVRLSCAARRTWNTHYHPDVVRARYDQILGLSPRPDNRAAGDPSPNRAIRQI
jgi:glycosyltransferase involved in cell wall biosynthesis